MAKKTNKKKKKCPCGLVEVRKKELFALVLWYTHLLTGVSRCGWLKRVVLQFSAHPAPTLKSTMASRSSYRTPLFRQRVDPAWRILGEPRVVFARPRTHSPRREAANPGFLGEDVCAAKQATHGVVRLLLQQVHVGHDHPQVNFADTAAYVGAWTRSRERGMAWTMEVGH